MASCVHLQGMLTDRCAAIVNARRKDGRVYGDLMHCAHCDKIGYLSDVHFYEHFLNERHYICVRMGSPIELYCCYCGDFEYSDSFDKKVERKRRRSAPLSAFHALRPIRVPLAAGAVLGSSAASAAIGGSSTYASTTIATAAAATAATADAADAIASAAISQRIVMRHAHAASAASAPGFKPFVAHSSRGICNMGSTCFISSVLQCILHNPFFKSSIEMQLTFNEAYDKGCSKATSSAVGDAAAPTSAAPQSAITDGCIACELRCLFAEAADDPSLHSASLIPSNLLFAVWIFAEYMAGYDQQDAHEFLIALLDGLGQHLDKFHSVKQGGGGHIDSTPRVPAGALLSPSKGAAHTGNNLVGSAFLGVLHSRLACLVCGNVSNKSDPLLDVSLSLESHNESGAAGETGGASLGGADSKRDPFAPISLRECLRYFTSKETLSELVACDRCQTLCPTQKSLSFAVAPRTLVLHLKRFDAIHQRKVWQLQRGQQMSEQSL